MQNKEEIRKNLYQYIEENIGPVSKVNHNEIKKMVLAHDTVEKAKIASANQKMAEVHNKIGSYLSKAKKLPQTPKIEGNVEALKMCLNWLSKDAE